VNSFHSINLVAHAWMVHACLADFGAEASIDLADFTMEVRARNRHYTFYPRFLVRRGEQQLYSARPGRDTRWFGGWPPYVNKRWPIGCGKFAFKDFCLDKGLPTPRMWRSPEAGMSDFLIKLDLSSSNKGMHGPFASYDPAVSEQVLPPGGYYEQFIRGAMVKAWFWEDRLAAIDIHSMPTIKGDGRSSLRELLAGAHHPTDAPRANWSAFGEVARYQGTRLDAVLPEGRELMADFRFASTLVQGVRDNQPTLDRHKDSAAVRELRGFGPMLWQGIPEDVRPATLFSLDAIVDAEDKVWLLEVNCNPQVHPEVYPFMLERLFGPRANAAHPRPATEPAALPANALPLQGMVPGAQHPPMALAPGSFQVPQGPTRWIS
jgi:hypothetical protein